MKRLLWMVVLICLLTSTYVFAESGNVIAVIPEFDIRVNDTIINTLHSKYPVIQYKGITYLPMTWDYLNGIGLSLKWSNDTGLEIDIKSNVGQFMESYLGSNNVLGTKVTAKVANYPIRVNGKVINNYEEEYPILSYKNITYFPMTWRFAVTEFGWKTKWSSESGFGIFVTNESNSVAIIEEQALEEKVLTSTQIGKLAGAVLKIEVIGNDGATRTGSGFFYNDSGGILTNYHIIENAKSITLLLNSQYAYDDEIYVAGYDIEDDIAILDSEVSSGSYIILGDSNTVETGDEIYTIGSPFGLLNTLSSGIIGSIRDQSFQITAPISHGSSGGVLLNAYGKAIGITNAGIIEGENLGFAIPINLVKTIDTSLCYSLDDLFEPQKKHATIRYDNGDSYYGEVQDNMKHGLGTYTDNSGNEHVGQYMNDQKHGLGRVTYVDGSILMGNWKNDQLHGSSRYERVDGGLFICNYFNGVIEGLCQDTDSYGNVYFGFYYNGVRHGTGGYKIGNGDWSLGTWRNGTYYDSNIFTIETPAYKNYEFYVSEISCFQGQKYDLGVHGVWEQISDNEKSYSFPAIEKGYFVLHRSGDDWYINVMLDSSSFHVKRID